MKKICCAVVYSRGTGLGNRLFPWARCKIFSHRFKIPMLTPQWAHLRSGPLLKGGVRWGSYHRKILLWDTFQSAEDEISRLRKLLFLIGSKSSPEPQDFFYLQPDVNLDSYLFKDLSCSNVFIFKGYHDLFQSLYPWRNFISERLEEITLPKWVEVSKCYADVTIGINCRRGKDFSDPKRPEDFYRGPMRTPLDWFVESLLRIRDHVGYQAKAYVVTDGDRNDLMPLLRVGNVELVNSASAISDLLILKKSKVLIASGSSSFSAWASFLGAMPTITPPGQSLTWFRLRSTEDQYVGDFNPIKPSTFFLNQAKKKLNFA